MPTPDAVPSPADEPLPSDPAAPAQPPKPADPDAPTRIDPHAPGGPAAHVGEEESAALAPEAEAFEGAFGVIGLGTMGRNLALNAADHGIAVAGYDLGQAAIDTIYDEAGRSAPSSPPPASTRFWRRSPRPAPSS